jgi:Leucine-rich repeat (LRR) protein
VLLEDGQVTFARILTGSVHRDSISNELLEDLIKVPNLRRVELAGSAITDRQLELIGKASSLETLDLSQTAIGDAGIQHLVNLDKLRFLALTGSRVTAEGIQQLKVALPDCNIGPSSGPVQPTRVTVPARTKVRDQPPE